MAEVITLDLAEINNGEIYICHTISKNILCKLMEGSKYLSYYRVGHKVLTEVIIFYAYNKYS